MSFSVWRNNCFGKIVQSVGQTTYSLVCLLQCHLLPLVQSSLFLSLRSTIPDNIRIFSGIVSVYFKPKNRSAGEKELSLQKQQRRPASLPPQNSRLLVLIVGKNNKALFSKSHIFPGKKVPLSELGRRRSSYILGTVKPPNGGHSKQRTCLEQRPKCLVSNVTIFVNLPPNSGHVSIADKFFKTRRCPLFGGFTILHITENLTTGTTFHQFLGLSKCLFLENKLTKPSGKKFPIFSLSKFLSYNFRTLLALYSQNIVSSFAQ